MQTPSPALSLVIAQIHHMHDRGLLTVPQRDAQIDRLLETERTKAKPD